MHPSISGHYALLLPNDQFTQFTKSRTSSNLSKLTHLLSEFSSSESPQKMKYRSGRSNGNADALSRRHPPGVQDLEAMLPTEMESSSPGLRLESDSSADYRDS
ncbi:hypothetical protein NQZ68_033687 [Dissostichus eleginoides]|nr:hypothetical protein NQZ68_033687 [Dissostichus eleginoides]